MEFRILGPIEVVTDEGKIPLGGPKQRAVLAHLILGANHPVDADRLIDGLWGEEPPETARNTLQTYVYRLRKLLGEPRVGGSNGAYVLNASEDEIDAARFEAIVREAKSLAAADPEAAAARFSDALTLWRGRPLADLADEPSLRGEAARLEELHLSAMEHRIAADIAAGGHSTVVSELEALTSRYPLRERMWANLMLALYHSGRQAEALSTYGRAREVLSTELGTDPSEQLQRLHEQILRRDPALGRPQPRPTTVRPSRIDLAPGTGFASYRIERTLGRGGMSVVYLAEHEWLQRKVALKVLAPQLAEDDRFRERFIRESRLAASLDHPNVIPIYEAGGTGGDLFIAMRYVEGSDLRTLLREGALDPARALAIVRQAAAALDAAHEQGLVHRDVKPGNVLLARARTEDEAEHAYLSDFGLTKRSASDSGVTGTGQFVGTLDYAAPEQFRGGAPDARTDVYSLGCVLFECLTGRPPFQADNDAALMYAHLQEPPPAVTAIEPGLPREIDHVVATAMAKAPADRYPGAGVLAREASRALGLGAGTAEGGPERRSVLRRLVPAIAAGVALVVGILVASLFQGDQPLPEAEGSLTSPSPSPSPTVPPTFRTVERALTPDEELLVSYIPRDLNTDCLPLDRPEPIHGERAVVVCRTAELEALYELFQTRDEMNEAFEVNVNNQRAPEGKCATESLAVGSYSVESEPAGSVLCYTIERNRQPGLFGSGNAPDQSHIEWTDDNTSIYAHAVRNDLADLSLYEWWVTSSGPSVPGAGGAPTEKDRPAGATRSVLGDGSYLVSPAGGCAGFRGVDCAMHISGDTYTQVFSDALLGTVERGSILLQKPDAVLFSPVTGWCFEPKDLGGGGDGRPAAYTWSAEGDEFRFERVRGGRCSGPQKLALGAWTRVPDGLIAVEQGGEIELVGPGGDPVRSTRQTDTNPNTWPDWSPDGSRIVFSGAGQGEQGFDLYVMNADGSGVERITDLLGDEYAPAWSPDGKRILFGFDDGDGAEVRTALATVAPDGSGLTELLTRNGEFMDLPTWSPDGEEIGFTLFTGGGIEAYRMTADGSDLTRLRGNLAVLLGWTPDGRRILLSEDTSLITVRPDGTGEQVLLQDPPENGRLVVDWSPDGGWIVASTPHGATTVSGPARTRVYLIRADGSETFWVGSGAEPSWRPEER